MIQLYAYNNYYRRSGDPIPRQQHPIHCPYYCVPRQPSKAAKINQVTGSINKATTITKLYYNLPIDVNDEWIIRIRLRYLAPALRQTERPERAA